VYSLLAKPSIEKDLRNISPNILPLINRKIHSLSENPRQSQTKKLKGLEGYRLRVGNYRILYEIDDSNKIVTICSVLRRKEAYR